MNQDEISALLRKKQQIRSTRDIAVMGMLKKHFDRMHFIQSSGVNMAAQTSAIINNIRKTGLSLSAANIDAIAETVADSRRYSDDEEEDGDGESANKHSVENNENKPSNLLSEHNQRDTESDIHVGKKITRRDTAEKDEEEEEEEESFMSEDISLLVTAMENQLEEYCNVLVIPSNNSVKFKESLKECNHAADQLAQQIKIIEDRSLENSKLYFDSLSDDEHKGGTARLVRSIGINVQSVEDSTRKLQTDITTSRKEFLKMSHLNGLLEVAPHHSYEKVRDTFAHIRRVSQKKSDESNKQWLQFEKKCREKQFAQMRRTYEMYVGSSDPAVTQSASDEGIQSFESKLQEHRVHVNHKLKDFHNTVIEISDKNIDKITTDADVLLSWRNKIIPWELSEQREMEASLASSVAAVEDKYSAVVDDLRDHHTHVLGQIDALEFHRQKLSHLLKIPAKKQRSMRERSGKFPPKQAGGRGGGGGSSGVKPHSLVMEDMSVPDNSLRLGTRTVNFGKLVSIDDEECLSLLSQMLHEVTPDAIVMKRLQQYTAHYTKLSSMKANAAKSKV
jgi:hypothetical protein